MKSAIKHLPGQKKHELEVIVHMIREAFDIEMIMSRVRSFIVTVGRM